MAQAGLFVGACGSSASNSRNQTEKTKPKTKGKNMNNRIQSAIIALAVLSTINFQSSTLLAGPVIVAKLPIPPSLNGITVNPLLNKVYLTGQGEEPVEIDGATFSQANVGSIGDGLDVDLANNNFWLAGLYAGITTVWNSANVHIATIPLGYCPTGVN